VEVYKILGVSVEGRNLQSGTESSAIINNSGLRVGDEVTIPGEKIHEAIARLWALKIFSDIQILIEQKVDNGVYLLIKIEEYPRLERWEIRGNDELDEDDIRKKVSLTEGQIITPDDIKRSVKKIQAYYEEEGYLLTTVTTDTVAAETSASRSTVLTFAIDEGPRVRIGTITVDGSTDFDGDDLEDEMEDTGEKIWWQFWSKPKFERAKFEADKERIVKFYRKNGYLDAEILSDSTWYSDDRETINILINVRDGARYKVRTITWDGATVYKTDVLASRLMFAKGDIFDEERFDQNLHGNQDQTDVSSLYLDNGYLRANLEPEFTRVPPDSIDITVHVFERNQFRVGRVDIKGNTKTHDNVIRRELYTRPGDFFDRSAIIRSIRQLSQLNYFNPEKLNKFPDVNFVDEKTVGIGFEVEEKSSDNVNASIGYSGAFHLTGALGFTINNFDISRPLDGGAGQIFSFEWQFGEGGRYRTFSLGLTEPWLFDTPTSVGLSLYDTRTIYQYDIRQTGVNLRVGRRLTWPDNYSRIDWTARFLNNDVIDNGGISYYDQGKRIQVSIGQTISRNSTDSPIFPAIGSIVSFTAEMAGGPLLPGTIDYHKFLLNTEWFVPIFNSSKIVLYASSTMGYVNGFANDSYIPPLEKFYMGGTGVGFIATTQLRGYEDQSIGPLDKNQNAIGGNVMTKYTTELRWSLTLNPIPIYLLAFAEAGNVFPDLRRTDLFDLKRSYGFGARLLIQPLGMVGFDYGFGMDDVLPRDAQADGWRFHFQFGRGF
jgi:outer membrane protein insertion porin family